MSALINLPAFRSQQRAPYYHPSYRVAVVRAVGHKEAERLLGSQLACKGIHVPEDPASGSLRGTAAEFWNAAFAQANAYYGDKKTASKTAWKALRCFFRQNGSGYAYAPVLPQPGKAPAVFIDDPGELTQLGTCIEYTYVDGNANLQVRRFPRESAPFLYWSGLRRTCYVFPGNIPGPCKTPDPAAAAAQTYKVWTQRDSKCLRDVDVPEVNVYNDGMFDTVVYASDKWHDPNPDDRMVGSQEYIHQVGDGVGMWQARGRVAARNTWGQVPVWMPHGDVPPALAFTGGCLDLEERGLIH